MSGLGRRAVARSLIGAALACAAVLLALPMAAGGNAAEDKSVYIVRMVESPAVAYTGGIAGYEATKPARGQKINPNERKVVRYTDYLSARHNAVIAKLGGEKIYDYAYAYNGFAARLTRGQVAIAKADPGVLTVEKAQEVTMDTATTPDFLGLTAPASQGGLWAKGVKGENIVVGIIDSGVWPESKSFSDRDARGKLTYSPNPGNWHGKKCPEIAEAWDSSMCNKKLIGAQFFCESRGCDGVLEHEFMSPRDFNGHGTHTASTAAGNENVPTTGAAALFVKVSGIAPRARVAAYKVCWDNGAGGCGANTGDSVAAIDKAVADGVDVLNYSISGTQTNYLDAVEVAYLFAADAGVFVATSAGNAGTVGSVAHISPWLAAVAAGTHDRSGTAVATLGNGTSYTGASLTPAAPSSPLISATDAGVAGAHADLVRQCFSANPQDGNKPVLDPAKVTGKIVVCQRGGPSPVAANARVDKSAAVKNAGGVGMILYNVAANSLNADLHSIPTVHVDHLAGPTIDAYAKTAGATASLSQATVTRTAPAPDTASFSSRGPSRGGGGDILKPDFMLPGQDILASVAPPGNAGKDFDIYSGTSMSSPHVAGAAALLSQAHPSWSPAAMRSAMATTASPVLVSAYSPLNAGSGHVQPNSMVNPGLVYDAGFGDYLSFLKGQGLIGNNVPAIDASDLNQPSLAVGDLAGIQTLTRTVTNVGGTAATYTAVVVAPAGFTVDVNPSSFSIPAGGRQQYTVTITRTNAPLSTSPTTGYRFGSLTWSDGTHSVRSPIVVRPVAIAAPTELTLSGASGSTSYGIKTGYNGALAYTRRGLIPSQVFTGTVPDGEQHDFNTGNPTGNSAFVTHDIATAADTSLLRISMFDAETSGADDIDLYLYRVDPDGSDPDTEPDLVLVGVSTGGTSAEQIQITHTALTPLNSRTFRLFVHGWDTEHATADYSLHSWALGTSAAENWTVAGPPTATIGGTGTVNLSWTGLEAGRRYLGQVRYDEGTTTHGTTIVRVNVP